MTTDLARTFAEHLEALEIPPGPDLPILVALSGGCDSVVLLHLLVFHSPPGRFRLSAAHLDHGMRVGSAGDAEWVRGLCQAWGVPLTSHRLASPPRSEDEARRARYDFLRTAADEHGAALIATAHHADDQAETVLFRILRGTGLTGLAGMSPVSHGLLRPLLPYWRDEIEAYAAATNLRWREDETNTEPGFARNRLRLQILPEIEKNIAPGARRNLVRLAELAAEASSVLDDVAETAGTEALSFADDRVLIARQALRRYDPAIGAQVVREAFRHFGITPDQAGTRLALQFITGAQSGRELSVSGGLRLRVEFETATLEPPSGAARQDRDLVIAEPRDGEQSLTLGGVEYRARWEFGRGQHAADTELDHAAGSATDHAAGTATDHDAGTAADEWSAVVSAERLRLPLAIRAWQPGDRIRLAAGTKKLKKLFLEQRVPQSERGTIPVLADASGAVLWVGGIAAAPDGTTAGEHTFRLSIERVHGTRRDSGEDRRP